MHKIVYDQMDIKATEWDDKYSQVSNMCKSLSGFVPSVPPNTNSRWPTTLQVWLSLGVGGVPFIAGWLHVWFTANNQIENVHII